MEMLNKKVFVVDDDGSVANAVRRYLQSLNLNLKIFCFVSPIEALEQVFKIKPFLIITDLQMPKMDGLEFASRVKIGSPEIYVILMTGGHSPSVPILADKFFRKDSERFNDELKEYVKSLL